MADNTGYFDTSYDVYDYERYKKKRKFIKQEIYVNYRQIIICSAVLGIIYILYNYCLFNFGMNGENICMSNMYVLYNFIINLPNLLKIQISIFIIFLVIVLLITQTYILRNIYVYFINLGSNFINSKINNVKSRKSINKKIEEFIYNLISCTNFN